MKLQILNSIHGNMLVTGTEVFSVPVEKFTIDKLPAGGTYAFYTRIKDGSSSWEKWGDLTADQKTFCEDISCGLECYISGVASNHNFKITW